MKTVGKRIVALFVIISLCPPLFCCNAHARDTNQVASNRTTASQIGPVSQNDDELLLKNKTLSSVIFKIMTSNAYNIEKTESYQRVDIVNSYLSELGDVRGLLLKHEQQYIVNYARRNGQSVRSLIVIPYAVWAIAKERLEELIRFINKYEPRNLQKKQYSLLNKSKISGDYFKTIEEMHSTWRALVLNEMITYKQNRPDAPFDEALAFTRSQKLNRTAQLLHTGPQYIFDVFYSVVVRSFDQYARYCPFGNDEENLRQSLEQSYDGVGVVINEKDNGIFIEEVMENSPASESNPRIHAGDQLLSITNVLTGGMVEPRIPVEHKSLDEISALLIGPANSVVEFELRSAQFQAVYETRLRRVHFDIRKNKVSFATLLRDEKKIGYLRVPSFYSDEPNASTLPEGNRKPISSTFLDARPYLEQMEADPTFSGLIIDLRDNRGGLVTQAVQLVSAFVPAGPVAIIKKPTRPQENLSRQDGAVLYSGPVLVLVNEVSASAAEMFTAAMQDYRRALVAGSSRTYGKGSIQKVYNLDSMVKPPIAGMKFGSLVLTVCRFYRVNGEQVQQKGVQPDIVLSTTPSKAEAKTQNKALNHSEPRVAPTQYRPLTNTAFDLDKIREDCYSTINESDGNGAISPNDQIVARAATFFAAK